MEYINIYFMSLVSFPSIHAIPLANCVSIVASPASWHGDTMALKHLSTCTAHTSCVRLLDVCTPGQASRCSAALLMWPCRQAWSVLSQAHQPRQGRHITLSMLC